MSSGKERRQGEALGSGVHESRKDFSVGARRRAAAAVRVDQLRELFHKLCSHLAVHQKVSVLREAPFCHCVLRIKERHERTKIGTGGNQSVPT